MKATTQINITEQGWIDQLTNLANLGINFVEPLQFPLKAMTNGKADIDFNINNSFLNGLTAEVIYTRNFTKSAVTKRPVDPSDPESAEEDVIVEIAASQKMAHYTITRTPERVEKIIEDFDSEVPVEIKGMERIKKIFEMAFFANIIQFQVFGLTEDQWLVTS